MNIPQGKPIIKNVSTLKLNYESMLNDLIIKKFNGYVCLTLNDKLGYEDGFIVFQNGIILGAYYNLLDKNKEFYSENAIRFFVKGLKSNFGALDVYTLTKEQTELLLTFNEKIRNKPINSIKYLNEFTPNNSNEELFVEEKEENKYDLFKKIGLGNIKI
jgi:hypothetical protein